MSAAIRKYFAGTGCVAYGADMASEIAKRIRAARAYAGFSQPQLAERLQVGRVHVTDIEMGRVEATENEIVLIARHCGLPEEFFTADFGALSAERVAQAMRDLLAEAARHAGGGVVPPEWEELDQADVPLGESSSRATGRRQAGS